MTLTMAESFDPYHRWLGIRDKQRPVNHYRLLGLEPLESDLEVIREAATRQLTYLKAHQNTARRDLCLQLMEEITDAKLALLDPVAKAQYDQQFGAKMRLPETAAAVRAGSPLGRSGGAACPQCGWDNALEREFCGGCGAGLWEPCLGCGATAGAWEKFCGTCGVQLAAMLQDRVAELAQKEQQIQRLLRQNHLLEAQPGLEELAAQTHPRLRPLADRARRALDQVETKLADLVAARTETLAQARTAAANGDDDRAADLLRSIAPVVATTATRELLAEVEGRRREVAALSAEIRAAVQAGQTANLLPRVDRLLELRPAFESAQRLRGKLLATREQSAQQAATALAKAARERALGHDYRGAVERLEQIAEQARTPAIRELLEQCQVREQEVSALSGLLAQRIAAHESHLPLAERLLKLQPHALRAQRWATELREAGGKRLPPLWAAPPGPAPRFGLDLAPLGRLRRIVGSDEALAGELQAQRGRVAVALGLALQGIGQAAVRTNLAPREKPKRLTLFSRGAPRESAESAWGIDLGNAALKAVRLTYDEANDRAIVDACHCLEYPRLLAADDPDRERVMSEALALLVESAGIDIREEFFCASLASPETLLRSVRLPPVSPGKVAELLHFEAAQQIPFPLEHVVWDYHLAAGREQEDGQVSEHEATIFAAKTALITRQCAPFTAARVPVHVLQSNSAALHNLFAYERGASREAVVVLEIGAESTDLVVSRSGGLRPRSIPTGGNHFTRALVRSLKLTQEQAERIKRQPHRAERFAVVAAAWQPVFESLLVEVQRSLSYFATQVRGVQPAQIICCGGGLQTLGLLEALRSDASAPSAN
ncbi:MAG: pilus assembly protein PilM [Pirellulales bacterium]